MTFKYHIMLNLINLNIKLNKKKIILPLTIDQNDSINDERFYVIQNENAPDSTWCQLATKDGFLIYFLKGVVDTYLTSPGIEFVVHDDGKAYADFNKSVPFEKYKFPVGYIFDKKE